jgi:hypothetical protein
VVRLNVFVFDGEMVTVLIPVAALAARAGGNVHQVDVAELQALLRARRAILPASE